MFCRREIRFLDGLGPQLASRFLCSVPTRPIPNPTVSCLSFSQMVLWTFDHIHRHSEASPQSSPRLLGRVLAFASQPALTRFGLSLGLRIDA